MRCATMLAPLGVLLASIATATAQASATTYTVDREPFPTDLHEGVIALMCVFIPLFVLALIAAAVQKPFRLAVVLSLISAVALVTTGIASWGATYTTAREIIQDRTELLLERAADISKTYLERELAQGILVLDVLINQVKVNQIQMSKTYPQAPIDLALLYDAFKAPDAIELIYYGAPGTSNATGAGGPALIGIGAPKGGDGVFSVWTQYDYGSPHAPFVKCAAYDRNRTATECTGYVCGTSNTQDFICQGTCVNKTNPATGSIYPGSAPEYCTDADGEARRLTYYKSKFSPNLGGSLTADPAQTSAPYNVEGIFPYNPMIRPWWTENRTIQIGAPYLFVGDTFGVGITMSVGAYDEQDRYTGCLAVDFSLASIAPLLLSVRPTDNTDIHIAGIDGALIGTTLPPATLSADTGVATDDVTFIDTIPMADSTLKRAFDTITSRYDGSLATAWKYRTTAHVGGRIYMSLPIDAVYAKYLLVLELPYSDAMGKADNASFVSLLITMAISIVMSTLMFFIVNGMLAPLRDLAQDMFDVACMKLEIPSAESRVAEVQGMQVSFKTMVEKLIEYREYLPQSVLMGDDEDMEDESEGSDAPKVGPAGGQSASTQNSMASSKGSRMSRMTKQSARTSMQRAQEKTAFVMELKTKSSSMLLVNAREFHQYMNGKGRSPSEVLATHATYLQIIVDACKPRKGVVEGFSGDRVTVGFNTVSSLGTHRQSALSSALQVRRESARRLPFGVNAACGSGKVLVGNMGTAGLKKFTILGDMASTVRGFERIGRAWDIDIIAGSQIVRDLSASFEFRALYPVQSAGIVHTMYEVVSEVQQEDDEWMYQLEQAAANSQFAVVNKACTLFFQGGADEALSVARTDKTEWGGLLVKWFQAAATPMPLTLSAPMPCEESTSFIMMKAGAAE